MAVRQKVINSLKCDACQKRTKWRKSMKLCTKCWEVIPVELQARIASGYDLNFDAIWKQPSDAWIKLVNQAVEIAKKNLPPDPKAQKLQRLQCFDTEHVEIKEQDKVRISLNGIETTCLVLGLAGENQIRVRTLTHPPGIEILAADQVSVIRNDIADWE